MISNSISWTNYVFIICIRNTTNVIYIYLAPISTKVATMRNNPQWCL